MGVAKKVQFRGGTTTSHQSFTGAEREVTVDITKKTLVVHDGITPGGIPLAKELETQNSLDLKVDKNEPITPNTNTKITYDSKGLILSGSNLEASDIPNLDASKITSGIIDSSRLPSFVDDVIEYPNLASFPIDGESGKIYIALDTNKTYRWSGSTFVYITSGAVDSVNGYTGIITLNKSDIGLSNVDNTSDVDKPISTATQDALDLKTNNTDIESVNLLRADKYLASQDIANMIYTDGNLSKIRYNNDTDVDYETFGYTSGNLSSINHYVDSVLKGTTTLSYLNGNLVSAVFVGV